MIRGSFLLEVVFTLGFEEGRIDIFFFGVLIEFFILIFDYIFMFIGLIMFIRV